MASVFFLGPLEVGGNSAFKRQRRTNTWPANGREERSVTPSGNNHCFTGGVELSQLYEKSGLRFVRSVRYDSKIWRESRPPLFLPSPPPRRGPIFGALS
jgi:hypothetical protein